jgi:serine/threonine-protein kinase
MNDDDGPSTKETSAGGYDESEVARVFDAYLADLEAGRAVDPARLLDDHPAIADQLRACLDVMQLANHVAEGSGSSSVRAPSFDSIAPPGSSRGTSRLTTLDLGPDEMPQVLLRELADDAEPLSRPRSTEMPRDGSGPARYQLQGEIARGGMGAILKGRDIDLGRDLAIKVLLEAHQGNPQITRRFVEEAQIGGQLQHPGIVPVYDLGTFSDRRPFFAMKLVKGQTLAALLAKRNATLSLLPAGEGARRADEGGMTTDEGPSPQPSPAGRGGQSDLPRFLSIFEAVCQTMAYAHARGVIHRDLKPSNVMVGSFGEVQVMDWGLAKVLPHGGVADDFPTPPDNDTVIMTVRSGSDADASHAGSVLGTPSYMSPEQARGEVDRVDERSDVFGLGAILCEILTGKPPFLGRDRHEIRDRAAQGDLKVAIERLDGCTADADLITLCRDCLAAEPASRLRDGSEVARRIGSYLAGVQERLRAAELAGEEAQTKAAEERKRRRVTVALAGSVLVIVGLAGGGLLYLARQRQEQFVRFNRALGQLEGIYADAKQVGDDPARWLAARNAARAVKGLLGDAPDFKTRNRLLELVANVAESAAAAEADQKLLAKLVDIRSAEADDLDGSETDLAFGEAFREAGIEVDALAPADAGAKIRSRPPSVSTALTAALDDWAAQRRRAQPKAQESWQRLVEVARVADLDSLRNRMRDLWATIDRKSQLESLRELARDHDVKNWAAQSLVLLAGALIDAGDADASESILRGAEVSYPGDVWVNYHLGAVLQKLSRSDEAIRFYSAARAIRPETAHELAHALAGRGQSDEAVALFRHLSRLRPGNARHLVCLGEMLTEKGLAGEAKEVLESAVSIGREQVSRRKDLVDSYMALGDALRAQGNQGDAISEYRTAIRLKPDYAKAHINLGLALERSGSVNEAITEYRTAIQLKPDHAEAYNNLGNVLQRVGSVSEAISEYRTAIRLKPDHAEAYNNLGNVLQDAGNVNEAISEYRTAIRLKPDYPEAHATLGLALRSSGDLTQAIVELSRARKLAKNNHHILARIERDLAETEHLASLASRLPAVLAGKQKPSDAAEMLQFAQLCYDRKLQSASARLWRDAFQAQPKLAEDMRIQNRYNAACAAALAGCGQGKDEPALDEAAKACWCKQAIEWLTADVAFWSKHAALGTPPGVQPLGQVLQHWKVDTDLAGIRDPGAVAKLPPEDREACQSLWVEVDALLRKAQTGQARQGGPPARELPADVFAS